MKVRNKRRSRRNTISQDERGTLLRISEQLDRLPVQSDVLNGINDKLKRDASRRGAIAGSIAGSLSGGIIALAIMFIRAKLER